MCLALGTPNRVQEELPPGIIEVCVISLADSQDLRLRATRDTKLGKGGRLPGPYN